MSKNNSRASLVAELQNTKQALLASERRGNKAVRRARALEKAIEPILERVKFWALTPLDDEANAPKVLTVGQCRKLTEALAPTPEDTPE